MKNFFSLLFFLVLSINIAFSQYSTPGTGINWSLEALAANSNGALVNVEFSNFVMHQDITISLNDTISVNSGALIEIETDLLLTIKGIFLSVPVYPGVVAFVGNAGGKGNFKGIRFENSPGSKLIRNHFLYGGGISLVSSNVEFYSCQVGYMNQSLCSGAITVFQSHPLIEECEFFNNAGPAILSAANAASSPRILNNFIHENVTLNINMPQINLGTTGVDTLIIEGNTITGEFSMAGGIALSTLTGGEIKCRVENNTISNNRYGAAFIGSNISGHVKGNVIFGNNIQNEPMQGGSGLNFYGGVTNALKVSLNSIYNNLWGITIQLNAKPNLGNLDPFDYNVGHNVIKDNGNSGEVYDLYNNSPNQIMAENNDWGTVNPDSIENHIFHQPDDPSLGLVDYLPYFDFTGVDESGKYSESTWFNVFPNPIREGNPFFLEIPDLHLIDNKGTILRISDIKGRLVYDHTITENESFLHEFQSISFPEGNYIIQLISPAGEEFHSKLVVY